MTVIRPPEIQESRGQAGEQRFNTSRRYNFANLYQMNRADDQVQKKADQFKSDADSVNQQMAEQVAKAKGATTGRAPFSQNQVDYATNKAKQISNQAQNFSVENEAVKAGQSPYQAGITGFYGGVSNPAIQQIRSYGNLYNTAMGRAAEIKKAQLEQNQAAAIPKPTKKPVVNEPTFMSQAQADARTKNRASDPHSDTKFNTLGTLDWALETGRINYEEYYAAQGGPGTPGYDAIKGKLI